MRNLARRDPAVAHGRGRPPHGVTAAGLFFAVIVLTVGIAAVVSANNLLFLILAAMLSTLLVSGFVSRLGLAGLELDVLVPEHVSVGRTVTARLFVRNLKRWMPSFSIHLRSLARSERAGIAARPIYFAVIPGGATLEELIQVTFSQRGPYRENIFRFSTRFPFGFLERRANVVLRREVLVYPCIDPQPGFEELLGTITGELESHYWGRGSDFYRIRPYQAFESARHVDWKATAHTRELQVREFAKEQERAVEIFLDRDVGPGGEEWFERAVDCCAFLCWRLSERSVSLRFRSQEQEIRVPEERDIYTILKYLALVALCAGKPAEPPVDGSSFQIVFSATPARFTELGWTGHLVGPDDLPQGAAAVAANP